MGASDLPLGVCQRIEQRWSAQFKRLQEERDLKARTASPEQGDDQHDGAPVDLVEWGRQRER
jgi:hypothetical protein